MAIITKKVRLIWKEFCDDINNSYIVPSISFNGGRDWMDLTEEVTNLRMNTLNNNILDKVYQKHYDSVSGLTEMDMSFGFTPYCTPAIEDITVTEIDRSKPINKGIGLQGGQKYYFAVGADNYDYPGLHKVNSELYVNNRYYDGGKNCLKTVSNVKMIDLTKEEYSSSKYYNINIYVNFSYFTRGIRVYYGTEEDFQAKKLKLRLITNLTQYLAKEINKEDGIGDKIVLLNKYPFPKTGLVKIDNEYIRYNNCEYQNGKWELTISYRDSKYSTYHQGGEKGAIVYLVSDDLYKTRVPAKMYEYPDISGMLMCLNFNSSNYHNIAYRNLNIEPEPVIKTNEFITNPFRYAIFDPKYGVSLKLNGLNLLNTNLNLDNYKDLGSIHFYYKLDGFNQTETTDPYLIYPLNDEGIYIRVNRQNSKMYVGYLYKDKSTNKLVDKNIISYEDYRLPVFSSDNFDSIGVSWNKYKSSDKNEYIVFNIHFNMYNNISIKSTILANDFKLGTPIIGGKFSDNQITSYSLGYIDEFTFYNKDLAVNLDYYNTEFIKNIDTELTDGSFGPKPENKDIQEFLTNCVLETKGNNTLPSIGDIILYNTGNVDKPKERIKYIYAKTENYDSISKLEWVIYSNKMSFNEIDKSIKRDSKDYAGQIIINGTEANYNDATNNDLVESANVYDPKINTILDFSKALDKIKDLETFDDNFIIKYDDKLLLSTFEGSELELEDGFIYPVDCKAMQIRYLLFGHSSGFYTPFLFSPSAIISEVSVL